MQNKLILRDSISPFTGQYADITQGSTLSWSQVDGNFIYLKGQTIFSATTSGDTLSFNKINGEVINVTIPTNSGSTSIIQDNIPIPIIVTLSEIGASSFDEDIQNLLAIYIANQGGVVLDNEIRTWEVQDDNSTPTGSSL